MIKPLQNNFRMVIFYRFGMTRLYRLLFTQTWNLLLFIALTGLQRRLSGSYFSTVLNDRPSSSRPPATYRQPRNAAHPEATLGVDMVGQRHQHPSNGSKSSTRSEEWVLSFFFFCSNLHMYVFVYLNLGACLHLFLPQRKFDRSGQRRMQLPCSSALEST